MGVGTGGVSSFLYTGVSGLGVSLPNGLSIPFPTLDLDFANTNSLDTRITFTRASNATYFDSSGVLQTAGNNVARFDHNPTTLQSLGLLIEEQRTNSLLQSGWAGAVGGSPGTAPTSWALGTVSGSPTSALVSSIYGTTDSAQAVLFSGVTGDRLWYQQVINVTNGTTYVVTLFCETITGTPGNVLSVIAGTATRSIISDQANNPSSATRASITFIATGTGTVTIRAGIGAASPLVANATAQLSRPQVEAGAFPTSYIPTTTAAATRNADVASMTGTNFSSWYNATEGTLYAEAAFVGLATARQVVNVSDNSANNLISIQTNPSTATSSRMNVISGGTTQSSLGFASAFTAGVFSKNAGTYKTDDFAFSSNGATATTDTSGTVPSVTQLQIGALLTTTSNIRIRRIAYFPVRLSNDQLQALTR